MSTGRVRNISKDEPGTQRELRIGDFARLVEPDELVEVPSQYLDPEKHAWDPNVWRITSDGTESKTSGKDE